MNHDPQLMAHLKQLKLSGILESLDMRLSQAITEQLSCADFLQRLIEDEVERRHRRQLDTRLRRAAFQPDKTLERFDFSFSSLICHHHDEFDSFVIFFFVGREGECQIRDLAEIAVDEFLESRKIAIEDQNQQFLRK